MMTRKIDKVWQEMQMRITSITMSEFQVALADVRERCTPSEFKRMAGDELRVRVLSRFVNCARCGWSHLWREVTECKGCGGQRCPQCHVAHVADPRGEQVCREAYPILARD